MRFSRNFLLSQTKTSKRGGASTVEFAVVSIITFFIIFALIVGGMGIFRYQEVAHLAREASRYASVRGNDYDVEGTDTSTGVADVTTSSELRTYLLSRAVALDTSRMSVNASWTIPSGFTPENVVQYVDTNPNLIPPGQVVIQNYVSVTVSYQWMPELLLIGPITLSSTSTVPMSY